MISSVDDRMQHRFLVLLLGLLFPLLLSPHSVSARAESSLWRGSQASTSHDAGQHELSADTAAAAFPGIKAQSATITQAFPSRRSDVYGSIRHIKPDHRVQRTEIESVAAWADVSSWDDSAGQPDGEQLDNVAGG